MNNQLEYSITVGELIDKLNRFPKDMPVLTRTGFEDDKFWYTCDIADVVMYDEKLLYKPYTGYKSSTSKKAKQYLVLHLMT